MNDILPKPANEVSRRFRQRCEEWDEVNRRIKYEYSRAYLREKYGYDVIGDYDSFHNLDY